jgi:DNA-binding NarL/FixJ family response regulator
MQAPQSSPEPHIRVLVVDDHFFTRLGLAAALNLEPGIGVVAEADSGSTALAMYDQFKPDVALLDGHLPDMHGAEVARQILQKHHNARLIIFSIEETEEDLHRAHSVGVLGYVTKGSPRPQLVQAVRTVARGAQSFSPELLAKLKQRRNHCPVSSREVQVLHQMAKGLPNKCIAAELGVSPETVKTYVARVMEKLQAEDRMQAVLTAVHRGLIRIMPR